MKKNINIDNLEINRGQLEGLPKNPRFIRDNRFKNLKKSIIEAPEMLELREILVYPISKEKYIVIAGNMRLRACMELGYKEVPCKVIDPETPVSKLREYVIKDNVDFGENDFKLISSEWNNFNLEDWGIENFKDFNILETLNEKKEIETRPFKKTHILISFSPEVLLEIQPFIDEILKNKNVEYEQSSN